MSRNLPVPYVGLQSQETIGREEVFRAAPRCRERLAPVYAAQLLGQDGQKRGLKGGAPVLAAARVAYLETEYAGPGDRRLAAGMLRRAAV